MVADFVDLKRLLLLALALGSAMATNTAPSSNAAQREMEVKRFKACLSAAAQSKPTKQVRVAAAMAAPRQ